ncbi:MAG: hypothetical protein FJ148_12210 [Deltaproteobacteria bacterium]|nr:hypothetical protein [Deltaproteobacteria bacterium]
MLACVVAVLALVPSAVADGAAAAAEAARVVSGPLELRVAAEPFGLAFADGRGAFLADAPSDDPSLTGTLGFRDATGWRQAVRVVHVRQRVPRGPAVLRLDTDDPAGRQIELTIAAEVSGAIALSARAQGATAHVAALGVAWRTADDERFFGLGERADAVEHRGAEVESYVSDGPYREDEYTGIGALLPPPGFRRRRDATYFPIPWLLSSRGYGVLVVNDDTAYHRFGTERTDAWSVSVQGAPDGEPALPAPSELRFVVFAGPTPADALERFSAWTGRQPPVASRAPWVLGPWYQPGGSLDAQRSQIAALRGADAPLSVAQTCLHYLPCGDDRTSEPARVAALHAQGVAVTTYVNPMLCESFAEPFRHALRTGALTRNPDLEPYLSRTSRRGRSPSGSTTSRSPPAGARSGSCSPTRWQTATTAGWRTSASTRRSTRARTTDAAARPRTTATSSATTVRRGTGRASSGSRSSASSARAGRVPRAARRWSGAAIRPPTGDSTGSSRRCARASAWGCRASGSGAPTSAASSRSTAVASPTSCSPAGCSSARCRA